MSLEQLGKNIAAKVGQKYARQVFDECAEVVHQSIEQFYAAYSPRYYKRTYAFHTSPTISFSKKSPTQYLIRIQADAVSGHEYPGGEEALFGYVFMQGHHGSADIVTQSPREYIDNFLRSRFSKA